jgi:hypothetical protein
MSGVPQQARSARLMPGTAGSTCALCCARRRRDLPIGLEVPMPRSCARSARSAAARRRARRPSPCWRASREPGPHARGGGGCGAIGARHVELIGANADARLCASPIRPPAPRRWPSAWAAAFATLDALLEAERPDAVVIATPNRLHADNALACIERGMPGWSRSRWPTT